MQVIGDAFHKHTSPILIVIGDAFFKHASPMLIVIGDVFFKHASPILVVIGDTFFKHTCPILVVIWDSFVGTRLLWLLPQEALLLSTRLPLWMLRRRWFLSFRVSYDLCHTSTEIQADTSHDTGRRSSTFNIYITDNWYNFQFTLASSSTFNVT